MSKKQALFTRLAVWRDPILKNPGFDSLETAGKSYNVPLVLPSIGWQ
jgi:hypothetical protein